MADTLVLDPAAVAEDRVEFDITAFVGEDGPDWGDAAIDFYKAQLARGEIPVDSRVPNRIITVPLVLRRAGALTYNQVRTRIQAKAALFQAEGGWLKRNSAIGYVFADVTGCTLKMGGSSGQALADGVDADAVLTIETLPEWYGDERALDSDSETTLLAFVGVLQDSASDASVAGDFAGRLRLVVTDSSGNNQLALLAGLRSRYYDSAPTAGLLYQAEALTPLDLAAIATVTGASGGASNNVVQHASLAPYWTPVLSTQIAGVGHMTHRGSYHAWARCYSTSNLPPRVRLLYDVGDLTNPSENAAVPIPAKGGFYLLDLGEVRLDKTPVGTHRWKGTIQAIGDDGGENISIDAFALQPVDDGAAIIIAEQPTDPAVLDPAARDVFSSGSALTGRTLPLGGQAWTAPTGVDTDDWAITGGVAVRGSTSDSPVGRMVTVGTTVFGNVVMQIDFMVSSLAANAGMYLVARGVGSSMAAILAASVSVQIMFDDQTAQLVVSGGVAPNPVPVDVAANEWYTVRVAVDQHGRARLWIKPQGAPMTDAPLQEVTDPLLLAGGTLDDGKVGLVDYNASATACTRTYDNFILWTPTEDAVVYANQSAELRTDGVFREDSTGTGYGPLTAIGNLLRMPPSGLEDRPVELFLYGSRGDLDALPDSGIDDIAVQPNYRPCWLYVPDGTS